MAPIHILFLVVAVTHGYLHARPSSAAVVVRKPGHSRSAPPFLLAAKKKPSRAAVKKKVPQKGDPSASDAGTDNGLVLGGVTATAIAAVATDAIDIGATGLAGAQSAEMASTAAVATRRLQRCMRLCSGMGGSSIRPLSFSLTPYGRPSGAPRRPRSAGWGRQAQLRRPCARRRPKG